MATVLFTWEQGGGLGHMMQMRPLAAGLAAAGHRVFLALRSLSTAVSVFDGAGVSYLQAPCRTVERPPVARPPQTFAHLLANVGFADERELFAVTSAWRNLYRMVRPDLVVFDHSPVALLAARGLPSRRALIGSGFCCPPDAEPLPPFRPASDPAGPADPDDELHPPPDPERLRAQERWVLERANRMLAHWKQPPLQRLGRLYAEVDENFLTTFRELDHYPDRPAARYWGPVNGDGGRTPDWPAGRGKRVYAYLKRFPELTSLLACLRDAGHPTIVYVDGLEAAARRRFESASLRFESEPLDLTAAARHCDLAVLHAGHGTTAALLLAGKPTLQIPLVLEQDLTARAVERLGAGVRVPLKRPAAAVARGLGRLFGPEGDAFAEAARGFARRYTDFDPQRQARDMLARAQELLAAK